MKRRSLCGLLCLLALGARPSRGGGKAAPRTWDDEAIASLEVPLAARAASARHVASDFYYRIPVRPIYKSYPVYHPDREPPGYWAWLQAQEPELAWDASKLAADEDWIRAGEIVFDAPIGYGSSLRVEEVRDRAWYQGVGVPLARDGTMPFSRYVIRKKGQVEIGGGACLSCHARVMPDGSLVKGAPGNFPADRALAYHLRAQAASARAPEKFLETTRLGQRLLFGAPWLRPDPVAAMEAMSIEEIAAVYEAIPPGVSTRVNLSPLIPAQIPDLIGVGRRRHLDRTGLVRQRDIADLMRYAALVQGANALDRFGDLQLLEPLPDPARLNRYSDEQLFALALYLCSLRPPRNPNPTDEAARRGREVFFREGCAACHTPPLYTNNMLTPADGFTAPEEDRARFDVLARAVGTDPGLALRTRKGTGYYKVPALTGLWYRGALEHSGSVAALEDWFDRRRTRADYVPTGFRGAGVRTRAVPGHEFGLGLPPGEKRDLIAFLRTL